MPKYNGTEAKAILAIIDKAKPPTQADIDRAKIAALHCKSAKEFCSFLELDPLVFKLWCNKWPSYNKAVSSWRDTATAEVEVALAKKAIGFTKTTRKDVLDKAGYVHTLETQTYFPPDPTAAQFWLKNRAPSDWKDASQVDVNVTANIRAWLVDAARASQGEGEMLDITPTEVSDHERERVAIAETQYIEQMTEAETVQPLSLNDAPQEYIPTDYETEVANGYPISPGLEPTVEPVEPPDTIPVSDIDSLSRLNGVWIKPDKSQSHKDYRFCGA